MKKHEYCDKFKKQCIQCPCSRLIYTNNNYETYIMCKFELRTIRDNIDKVLSHEQNNWQTQSK